MPKEASKLLLHRFFNRILESGLLLLSVALRVGAAGDGFYLFAHVQKYSEEMLSSPEYREIVVTTQDSAEEMTTPVVQRPAQERAILTAADLSAAEIIPYITKAYVSNETRLWFLNSSTLTEMRTFGPSAPGTVNPPGTLTTTGTVSPPGTVNTNDAAGDFSGTGWCCSDGHHRDAGTTRF